MNDRSRRRGCPRGVPRRAGRHARFGVYLPGITFDEGYRVKVKVIHESDQFRRQIPPPEIDLVWHDGSPLDLWDATVPLSPTPGGADQFGQPGRYLYRFELGGRLSPLTFRDPFARESGLGTLAAVRVEPWQERIEGAGALQPSVTVPTPGDRVAVTAPSNCGAVDVWSAP